MKITPLKPLPFFAIGVLLSALKVGLDFGLAALFEQEWSLLFYVNPPRSPLFSPGDETFDLNYYLSLFALAVPFFVVGVWLTAKRLQDAGAPKWLLVLFFVPFANLLFFVTATILPSRPAIRSEEGGPYRTHAPLFDESSHKMFIAVLMSACAGTVLTLGLMALSVGVLGEYGTGLFMGVPTIATFATTLIFFRLIGSRRPHATALSLATAMTSLGLSMGIMILFAIEGLICLLMAMPLALIAGVAGWAIALAITKTTETLHRELVSPALIVPAVMLLEAISPMPTQTHMVETEVVVDAEPSAVWNHVVAFPELPPIEHWLFRVGVAAPVGAVIEGEGVGAIRRCQFTTGEFVEPIEVWDPPRELGFGVLDMPDTMHELSPWDIRPRHLDGYFKTTRGQFLLERIEASDGAVQTRLRGRTYYELEMAPVRYWGVFADAIIHQIHLRVLTHVKTVSEDGAYDSLP